MSSNELGGVAPDPLQDVHGVAVKLTGRPLAAHTVDTHLVELQQLAGLPHAKLTSSARRTLSKRGELDPVWWLKLATENTTSSAPSMPTRADLQRILDGLMTAGSPVRSFSRADTRRRNESWRQAEGNLCTACGSVMALGQVCGCRVSENAGRCNN